MSLTVTDFNAVPLAHAWLSDCPYSSRYSERSGRSLSGKEKPPVRSSWGRERGQRGVRPSALVVRPSTWVPHRPHPEAEQQHCEWPLGRRELPPARPGASFPVPSGALRVGARTRTRPLGSLAWPPNGCHRCVRRRCLWSVFSSTWGRTLLCAPRSTCLACPDKVLTGKLTTSAPEDVCRQRKPTVNIVMT